MFFSHEIVQSLEHSSVRFVWGLRIIVPTLFINAFMELELLLLFFCYLYLFSLNSYFYVSQITEIGSGLVFFTFVASLVDSLAYLLRFLLKVGL